MRNQLNVLNSLWSFLLKHSTQVLAGTSLVMGVSVVSVPVAVNAADLPTTSQDQTLTSADAAKAPASSLSDGVYLYGQSSKPEQVGQGYFVFEVNRGAVVGALYMPRSSFDCTSGTFRDNQLALTVVNSYDRTANPFEIALEKTSNVASSANPMQQIGLQGFHRLDNVSENDQRILNVCKADLQQQAKQ